MKKFLAILALAVMLAIPGLAAAQGSGLYVTPKFLAGLQNTGNISRTNMGGMGMDRYDQFTFGGGLAGGYNFWDQHMIPIRVELDLGLRSSSEKTWSGPSGQIKGRWNSSTLFGNVYLDLHNDTPITPYVGAGLGAAFNYVGYDVKQGGDSYSMDDRFTNFAWNVGVGAAYNFNENVALDIGYRYMSLGENTVKSTIGGVKHEVSTNPYGNEFMLGLRFGF